MHEYGIRLRLDSVPFFAGNSHHAVGELLKDANFTNLIGLAEVAACNTFAKAQMMECRLERSKRNDEVSETASVGQLVQRRVPAGGSSK